MKRGVGLRHSSIWHCRFLSGQNRRVCEQASLETRFVSKARVVPDKYSTQVSRRFFYYRMETDECPGASSSMAGSNCEITDSELHNTGNQHSGINK